MKKLIFLIFLLLLSDTISAQLRNGRFEVSATGALGSFSITTKSDNFENTGSARVYLNTAVKCGYIFLDGFEIEPEVFMFFSEKNKPTFVLSANFAYNFLIREENWSPFVLAGYGTGNAVPTLVLNNTFINVSDNFDVNYLNAGAGIKYYLNDYIGLRIEYRFQRINQKVDTEAYNYEVIVNTHNLLLGFSILI